jgi:hypothetical protein
MVLQWIIWGIVRLVGDLHRTIPVLESVRSLPDQNRGGGEDVFGHSHPIHDVHH